MNSSDIKFTHPLIQTYIQHKNVRQGQGHGQEVPEAPAPGPLPRRPQGARPQWFQCHGFPLLDPFFTLVFQIRPSFFW